LPAPPRLENPDCPLCDTPPPGGDPGYAFPPYGVVRCPGCGLWYLSPRLAEASMLDAYRADAYFAGLPGAGYSDYLAQEGTLRETFRRLLAAMAERGMTGGSLLEIGCAHGFFLDEARPYFARRVGTEYSPGTAARARAVADAVHLGGLAELPAGESFDCAALIHVLEHVYAPRELLVGLRERLRPGGFLLVACPDMGGFWRRLLGRRWPFFKVPEHVTYFDGGTLSHALEAAGFEAVSPIPYASLFTGELIGEKLGRRLPAPLARQAFRLPATTVARTARRPA
jgi:SAM-dependent methyltransferase